jgi:hypothetical protein
LKNEYRNRPEVVEKIDEISKYDPTGGRFLTWLVKVFADNSYPIGFWNYAKEILKMYDTIIGSPSLAEMYGVSRDIGQMDPDVLYNIWSKEYGGFGSADKEDLTSQALRAKKIKEKGSRVIYNQGGYKVIQFGGTGVDPDMAVEALCMFGAGTEWCTRREGRAESYLEKGPVYMIFKGTSKVAQVNEEQIQDTENRAIDLRKNSELTQVLVGSGIISPMRAYKLLSSGWGDKDPWPELEPALAKDPETAFKYADYYLHGRFPLGEKVIAQNPNTAYMYAMIVLGDRFPEGEEAILSDPKFGPKYQKDIDEGYFEFLRGRQERKSEQFQNV